jgi:hypothetical protein
VKYETRSLTYPWATSKKIIQQYSRFTIGVGESARGKMQTVSLFGSGAEENGEPTAGEIRHVYLG